MIAGKQKGALAGAFFPVYYIRISEYSHMVKHG